MSDVVTPVPSDVVGLSPSICLGFGVGTVGVSIMLNTVTAYFPAFMSTVLGQSPVIAGALLMGSKLFDAVADILIGRLSDRTRSRWGRRRPYLLVGAFVSAVAFLLLFAPPPMTDRVLVWYMAAALIIYSAGYSLFNVPYMTMPSEITQGFHERSRLLSYRTVFVSIGQLIGLAVTAALIERGGGGAAGYRTMGLVMMLIIFASMFATFLGTATAARVEPRDAPQLAGSQLMLLARNRPFMLLAGAKVFQFLAFASSATTGLLFLLNVLHVGYGGQIQFAVSLNLALAGSMPVWVRIGQRIGKRNTYLLGVTLYCAAALSWLVADTSITRFGPARRMKVALPYLADVRAVHPLKARRMLAPRPWRITSPIIAPPSRARSNTPVSGGMRAPSVSGPVMASAWQMPRRARLRLGASTRVSSRCHDPAPTDRRR